MHPSLKSIRSLFAKRALANLQWALCVLLLCSAGMAQAQLRPFGKAFQANAPGDILIVGNTITTCQTTAPTGAIATVVTAASLCAAARNGTATPATPTNNNNNLQGMINVDVDPAAPGANSSTAGLSIPVGASVLWAGLYWGGDALATSARNQLSFKTPVAGYQALTADWLASNGANYHAGKTVTSLITASGNYTAADIKTSLTLNAAGAATVLDGGFGGWALVVVYQLNSEQFRNLTVFDGYQTGLPVTIPLSGFLTPSTGVVGARVGLVTYEGDFGTPGDRATFNGTDLTNALNPANNFLNSSITRLGAQITDKNPNYGNQLGFDIDVVDASGVLPNGATTTTLVLSSSGDAFYPGVVTTAIDIFVPNLAASLTKTVVDLNGGVLDPGDILEYTISFKNTGLDIATKVFVIDPIPVGTAYVPGSLKVVAGANAGAKTDAIDADQAEFDSAQNRTVFRLGTGASGINGGSFAPGNSTTITFQVKVNPSTYGQTITNIATINYTGTTLPTTYTANASAVIAVAPLPPLPTLAVTKTVADLNGGVLDTGDLLAYTITIKNSSLGIATKVFVIDPIPSGTTFVTGSLSVTGGANAGAKTDAVDADQAEFDSALNRVVFRLGTGAGGASGGSLGPGDTTTITFQVKVSPGTNGQTITNIATINYMGAVLPTVYTANASATITAAPLAVVPLLTNQKTVLVVSDPVNGMVNPKNIPGAENVYTLTVQNTGSGAVDTNTLVLVDLIPVNSEVFTGNLSAGAPYLFTDGALPSGLTCSFTALGNTTDCIDFSKDSGLTWVYVPNGSYDPAVTHIRFRLTGAMNGDPAPGSPYPSFSVQFKTRVK
jgi:uncharacterized repeat protein (TIGR01451 family)